MAHFICTRSRERERESSSFFARLPFLPVSSSSPDAPLDGWCQTVRIIRLHRSSSSSSSSLHSCSAHSADTSTSSFPFFVK